MTKTVVALYSDFHTAQQALAALVDGDFPRADISLIAQDETHGGQAVLNAPSDVQFGEGHAHASEAKSDAAAGAGAGAILGGLAGLVMGLSALAVPGIGPILAAGPLATALAGAGLGTVTGGVIGALAEGGVPEDEAGAHAEGLKRGGTLVAIRTSDERAEEARALLYRFGPMDADQNDPNGDWKESEREQREAMQGDEMGDAQRAAGLGWEQNREAVEHAAKIRREEEDEDDDASMRAGGYDTMGAEGREFQGHHERFASERQGFGRGEDTDAGTFRREVHRPGEGYEMQQGGFHAAEEPAFGNQRSEYPMENRDMGTGNEDRSMAHRHDFEGQDDDLYRGIAGSQHPGIGNRGEQMDAAQGEGRDYDSFLPEYQDHFNILFADHGQRFDDFEPAYHYGYDLARMERYQSSHWSEIEPQAMEEWERVFPDWPWSEAKDAVRHAWERAAGTQPPGGSTLSGHSRLEGYGAGPDQGYEQTGF